MLRMCGVSAEEDGFAFAREQLINQSAGLYCDAELLFREEMAGGSPDESGGVGAVVASSGQQVTKAFLGVVGVHETACPSIISQSAVTCQ